MKVLIWIGCFLVATILNTLLGAATGIKAGYLVFYFAVYFVAKKLCNKWDERKTNKTPDQTKKEDSESTENVCEMCGRVFDKTTPPNIAGDMGVGHINLCDACMELYGADPDVDTKPFDPIETPPMEVFNTAAKIQFCRKCGNKLLEDALFCTKCGTKIITEKIKENNHVSK